MMAWHAVDSAVAFVFIAGPWLIVWWQIRAAGRKRRERRELRRSALRAAGGIRWMR